MEGSRGERSRNAESCSFLARRLDYPNELVDKVVKEVCRLVPKAPLHVANHEIDIGRPADEVMQAFDREGQRPGVRGCMGWGGAAKAPWPRRCST